MTTLKTRCAAFALALTAGAGPFVAAQDLPLPGEGFTWERVGDQPIEVRDLTFGDDGTLWATADFGPHRLDLSGGFPGTWVLLRDTGIFGGSILPLGPDTLLANTGSDTRRSLDGGLEWAVVYPDDGDEGLYAVPAGYPFAGRILTGDLTGAAYSTDRGASFTPSAIPGQGTGSEAGGHDFVALPPGSSHPARVLMAGRWGISLSDDGGATFVESGLYGVEFGYVGLSLGTVERSGGDRRVVVGGYVSSQPDLRVWYSDDAGASWHPEGGGTHLPEGPPLGVGNSDATVLSLGGPSALAVLGRGTIYRTDDAGETWEAVGRAPDIAGDVGLDTAALDGEGRLYVGLFQTGPSRGWTYRTAEVVTTSAPGPEPTGAAPLTVAVHPNPSAGKATVAFTLGAPRRVEAVLYDVLGRRVAVLGGFFSPGAHAFPLDGSALPTGIYVVRLAAGGAVATRRVTFAR
jgi:hypothetical protein